MKHVCAPATLALFALAASPACKKKEKSDSEKLALPGAEPLPPAVAKAVRAALDERGDDDEPRTRHREDDGSPSYTNRLILEGSPYLQQHAHNPVDWYPWGEEAFAAAVRLDRPIFLSIGYSTCHWCHVMEEESFEDLEIARYLNEHYIAIKVDREQRPDVDAIYMRAAKAMGKSGGWPLNVWLTAEREPFFAGTYFPPRDERGQVGFLTILQNVGEAFDERRGDITSTSAKVTERIRTMSTPPPAGDLPGDAVLHAAAAGYRRRFDRVHGGLRPGRRGSKFPSSLPIRFLLRYHRRTGDAAYLEMAVLTLDKMAAGGIYDQIGGGFHRYATDPRWLVPHFEKMLYDNARLAVDYLEAAQATGASRYADIAAEILDYVERDMTSPRGAFYAATDADSETPVGRREEGYFFTWTPDEIRSALSSRAAAQLVIDFFAVTPRGHVEGRSVLHTPRSLVDVAGDHELSVDEAGALLEASRREMRRARDRRPPPLRDEKILTAWNGLMISAFARASRILPSRETDPSYARVATRAAEFVLAELREDGRLLRSHVGGLSEGSGYLDDYAFFIAGLLDLFEATGDRAWLGEATALTEVVEQHFAAPGGGYFRAASSADGLLVRDRPMTDSALPSGNSVHALNLLRLHQLTTDDRYRQRADDLLRSAASIVERDPTSASELLLAIDFRSDTPKEIAIVTAGEGAPELTAVLGRSFVPNRVSVVAAGGRAPHLAGSIPWLEGKVALRGAATAYVCEERRCELPTSDPEVFATQLGKVVPLAESSASP